MSTLQLDLSHLRPFLPPSFFPLAFAGQGLSVSRTRLLSSVLWLTHRSGSDFLRRGVLGLEHGQMTHNPVSNSAGVAWNGQWGVADALPLLQWRKFEMAAQPARK